MIIEEEERKRYEKDKGNNLQPKYEKLCKGFIKVFLDNLAKEIEEQRKPYKLFIYNNNAYIYDPQQWKGVNIVIRFQMTPKALVIALTKNHHFPYNVPNDIFRIVQEDNVMSCGARGYPPSHVMHGDNIFCDGCEWNINKETLQKVKRLLEKRHYLSDPIHEPPLNNRKIVYSESIYSFNVTYGSISNTIEVIDDFYMVFNDFIEAIKNNPKDGAIMVNEKLEVIKDPRPPVKWY